MRHPLPACWLVTAGMLAVALLASVPGLPFNVRIFNCVGRKHQSKVFCPCTIKNAQRRRPGTKARADLLSVLCSSGLQDHHLFKSGSSSTIKVLVEVSVLTEVIISICINQELDALFSEWGDQDSHAPVLLAWVLMNFATQQHSEGLEVHQIMYRHSNCLTLL